MSDPDYEYFDEQRDMDEAAASWGLTADEMRCLNCGHVGQAKAKIITDWVPYGSTSVPMESLDDETLQCIECGSKNLEDL